MRESFRFIDQIGIRDVKRMVYSRDGTINEQKVPFFLD